MTLTWEIKEAIRAEVEGEPDEEKKKALRRQIALQHSVKLSVIASVTAHSKIPKNSAVPTAQKQLTCDEVLLMREYLE